jgi:cystathionine beta-lyase/cystathionine gamma-synthase
MIWFRLKGGDVIKNTENDAAKERLLSFFSGRTSVKLDRYAKRVEKNPKVVLVASKLKMVTMLVSKAHKQDNHVYMKKTAMCLNQAEKTKNLKYQEAHEFVWKLVQER